MKMNKAREQLINMYIDSLEENKLPWKKGWDDTYSVHHFNPVSKTNYRGVNNSLLSIISAVRGYKDPRWLTFNQIKQKEWVLEDAKGQGVPIEFWSIYDTVNKTTVTISEYNDILEKDPDRKKDFKMMDRIYHVFNATHIKGIPEFVLEEQPKKVMDSEPFIDNLIKNMGVLYYEQGNRAYYSPSKDAVTVPESYQFHSGYDYNSTRLHELCHATAHSSRLNRDLKNKFGTPEYAKEELRAEIASSFIAQDINLDISQMDLDNHKAYIQSWISILRKEPNELFKAIKDAENICEYILETGEIEKFRLQESGEVIKEPEVISLEKFLSQKGLALPVSDYMIDKSKIPHGLTNKQWSLFEKDAYTNINEYHEKRKEAIKEYNQLVKEGKIRPLTAIEASLEQANGHPDNEATPAARRMLAKRGIDWYTGNEITSDLTKPRYFIDMDGTLAHFNNTIPSLDVLHEEGYYRHLLPQQKVIELTEDLLKIDPKQVYILSATLESPYAAKDKIEWVKEYLPTLPHENIILTPYGQPKYEYVPGGIQKKDVLLDDYTNNLISWENNGGKAIKVMNNINSTKNTWNGCKIHYLDDPKKMEQSVTQIATASKEEIDKLAEASLSHPSKTMLININYKNKDILSVQDKLKGLNNVFSQIPNGEEAPEIRVNLDVDDRPFLRNEKITKYDLLQHNSLFKEEREISVFEVLNNKAKNNLLLHAPNSHDLEKYAKLEHLLSEMRELLAIEESISLNVGI